MSAAPALDGTGRAHLVLAFGDAAHPLCADWAAQAVRLASPLEVHAHKEADGNALAYVDALLAAATIGTRVLVVGPARDARRTVARARRAGVLPGELTVVTLQDDAIDVFCPHCAATTETRARPGDTATCGDCRRTLEVRDHVASWTGTFLGSGTDSEPRDGAHSLPVPTREALAP